MLGFLDFLCRCIVDVAPYVGITLSVVFVHEFGHYWAGRLIGAPISAFSVGFGRELVGWTTAIGVRWKLCAIPLGGYVRFVGDADASSRPDRLAIAALAPEIRGRLLASRPAWQRVFVLVAGPLANVVFAVVTMSGFFMAYGLADYRPVIGALKPGFPAADAGLAAGDEILAIDGSPVEIFRDLSDAVQDAAGRPVSYLVRSEGRPLRDVIVVPRPVEVETVFGKERRFQIGIQASSDPADRVVKKFGLDSGVAAGAREIWRIGKMTAIAVGNIVAGRIPLSTLSGPVKIAEVAHVAVALGGLQGFAALMAMISCSVGLINLLPVPVLDGGHLATIAVETVIGRRLSERAQEVLYRFGFACLGCLVILITANDLIGLLDR